MRCGIFLCCFVLCLFLAVFVFCFALLPFYVVSCVFFGHCVLNQMNFRMFSMRFFSSIYFVPLSGGMNAPRRGHVIGFIYFRKYFFHFLCVSLLPIFSAQCGGTAEIVGLGRSDRATSEQQQLGQ